MDGVGKIVEGVNALEAALNSNRVRKVFVLDKKSNKSNKFNVLIENIKKQNIQFENDINVSINKFIAKRNEYRNNKEFDKADYMRNRLDEIGIVIEDGNESGWRWKNS